MLKRHGNYIPIKIKIKKKDKTKPNKSSSLSAFSTGNCHRSNQLEIVSMWLWEVLESELWACYLWTVLLTGIGFTTILSKYLSTPWAKTFLTGSLFKDWKKLIQADLQIKFMWNFSTNRGCGWLATAIFSVWHENQYHTNQGRAVKETHITSMTHGTEL